jgi:hypothetical protein
MRNVLSSTALRFEVEVSITPRTRGWIETVITPALARQITEQLLALSSQSPEWLKVLANGSESKPPPQRRLPEIDERLSCGNR